MQQWAKALGRRCVIGTGLFIVVVSAWTALGDPQIATRWFSWPNVAYLAPVPVITAALVVYTWRAFDEGADYAPFLGGLALFLMSYVGIAISRWPMIVPGHFTLDEAAASQSTQAFLLIGTLILLPIILTYTAWSYWVFRGKVTADVGYH
jgi:cytochrome d ubiquinol oxidase subunit II